MNLNFHQSVMLLACRLLIRVPVSLIALYCVSSYKLYPDCQVTGSVPL